MQEGRIARKCITGLNKLNIWIMEDAHEYLFISEHLFLRFFFKSIFSYFKKHLFVITNLIFLTGLPRVMMTMKRNQTISLRYHLRPYSISTIEILKSSFIYFLLECIVLRYVLIQSYFRPSLVIYRLCLFIFL